MPASAGQRAREGVRDDDDAVGGHAGHPRGALVGAGGEHLPTQRRAAVEQPQHDDDGEHGDDQPGDGQTAQRARPTQADEVRGQRPEGVSLGGDVHEAGEDARRAQRDHEGVDAGRDDDDAVDGAQGSARKDAQQDRDGPGQAPGLQQPAQDHGCDAADGAHGDVHLADGQDDHLRQADHDPDRDASAERVDVEVRGEARCGGGKEQPGAQDEGQEAEAIPEVDQSCTVDGHVRWLRCWLRSSRSRPATTLTNEVERRPPVGDWVPGEDAPGFRGGPCP